MLEERELAEPKWAETIRRSRNLVKGQDRSQTDESRERDMRWVHRKSVQQRNRQGVGGHTGVTENVRDQTHRSDRIE